VSPHKQRVTLLVEVDLAETGELSTINHWRMLLQRQLDDFAAPFRPYVRGQSAPVAVPRSELSHENPAA
jgi:hypothetical protein